jgi:F-type H+-transporting ATPase subunit delta
LLEATQSQLSGPRALRHPASAYVGTNKEKRNVAEQGPIVSGIAGRYASALFDLAEEEGKIDAIGAELDRFSALINGSDDLKRFIKNPVFTAAEQLAAVTALLKQAKIAGLGANFIKVVASKRRLFAIEGMVSGYRALVADKRGVISAEVTVAEAMSDKNSKTVKDALASLTGKTIAVTEKVDPSIIGGLIVKMGSKMVDASVRTKLNSMKLAMKEAG